MIPLTPPGCDLRDFQYMPLDVVRLRDSELATVLTGDEAFAAVLLWCASWHQVPAASLPDDDRQLANLAGYGRAVKEWAKVRAGALRGFVKCEDGRLYHPVVAEKAREAWEAKLQQRYRTECARIKKEAQRHNLSPDYPTFEAWVSRMCPEGQPPIVPRDTPPVSPDCPPGNDIQGKGREGIHQELASLAPAGEREAEPTLLPLPIPADDPDWQAWRQHRIARRAWSISAERCALGDLRTILADGGDLPALLRYALKRNHGDLLDSFRQQRAEAAREAANDKLPGESSADASVRRSLARLDTDKRSGPATLLDLLPKRLAHGGTP